MILDEAWRLSPSIALRPEPFGALVTLPGNRKLTFLKRAWSSARVVEQLADHTRRALDAGHVGCPEGSTGVRGSPGGPADADMIRTPLGRTDEAGRALRVWPGRAGSA